MGRDRKGGLMEDWPEYLRVREFPAGYVMPTATPPLRAVAKVDHAPPSESVEDIIKEINSHVHNQETKADAVAKGEGLVKLFGYRDRKRNIDIPRRIEWSKKTYPSLKIQIDYSWVKVLMKIAMSDIIRNPDNWEHLPDAVTSLHQIAQMRQKRFAEGIVPDAMGYINIHPTAHRKDLKTFREAGEPIILPKSERRIVLMTILSADDLDKIPAIVDALHDHDCKAVAQCELLATKKREMVSDKTTFVTTYALREIQVYKRKHGDDE